MAEYWLIKTILLIALAAVGWLTIRPARSANHLAIRRLGMMVIILFAFFAVLFPSLLNELATRVGVERGINLLVYVLVLAFFVQMATSYRRDSEADKRLTLLARAVALSTVTPPDQSSAGGSPDTAADGPQTDVLPSFDAR